MDTISQRGRIELSTRQAEQNDRCDGCNRQLANATYIPLGTLRGAQVFVCDDCGLCQTKYSKVRDQRHAPSTSSQANWGNVRHGKGLRLDAIWPNLKRVIENLPANARVLDIGANRGDFLARVMERRPDLETVALEPDENLIDGLKKLLPRSEVVEARFENWNPNQEFDFIFCLHTLEHASSARGMIRGIHDLLSRAGSAYIEVPSLEFISDPRIVEEFFIDKHSFHFDESALKNLLAQEHLKLDNEFGDQVNLGLLVSKSMGTIALAPVSPQVTNEKIRHYADALTSNLGQLTEISRFLRNLMARQRVCIWGAGRIYDAIERAETLSGSDYLLVDDYLSKHLTNIHGHPLMSSQSIRGFDPQIVVLLTRSATTGITAQLSELGYRHVLTFPELLDQISA